MNAKQELREILKAFKEWEKQLKKAYRIQNFVNYPPLKKEKNPLKKIKNF